MTGTRSRPPMPPLSFTYSASVSIWPSTSPESGDSKPNVDCSRVWSMMMNPTFTSVSVTPATEPVSSGCRAAMSSLCFGPQADPTSTTTASSIAVARTRDLLIVSDPLGPACSAE